MTKAIRFRRRRSGERRDEDMLPLAVLFGRFGRLVSYRDGTGDRDVGKLTVIGQYHGARFPEGGEIARKAQRLAVTLKDGTIVPAYRLGPNFAVCQDFNRKAIRPKRSK